MTNPTVSVIIPNWNRAADLRRAIASVLAQTAPVLEVLVCDDGSTDESQDVVRQFDPSKVIWLGGEHIALPAAARNRGIKAARGEFLAFLDNDDEWLPQKITRQLEAMQQQRLKASCSNAVRFSPNANADTPFFSSLPHRLTFADLLRGNKVICSSAVLHRSVLAQVESFPMSAELRALEDYALWLRVATVTEFACCDEPLVRYQDQSANSVRALSPHSRHWQQRRLVLRDFLDWAGQRGGMPLKRWQAWRAYRVALRMEKTE
mgnify:CR=1 FL=1